MHLWAVDTHKTLVVIGGGAAGFFCAVNAAMANPNLNVIILEKSGKVLQKVKVSGGGRCNVTHACFEISALIKRYPRGEKFLKKAFHFFNPAHTIDWFAKHGVQLKTEADGRMFPVTDDSQTIIDCLLGLARQHGVEVRLHSPVTGFMWQQQQWRVQSGEKLLAADFLCIASGGFAKREQFDWLLKSTNHSMANPVPSLFTFNLPGNAITKLMGVAVPMAGVKIAGHKYESQGPVLITHWGLSGPAVLRTSAFAARELAACHYKFTVIINWLPAYNENSLREKILEYRQMKGTQKVLNTDWITLPQRLWTYLLEQAGVPPEQRWADLPALAQNKIIKSLCACELPASGKTTFKEEFVTAGGIHPAEIDPNTMMSRLHPQLFFAGEIMDIDGITGGFNFQHAWTSGYIAAQHIAKF